MSDRPKRAARKPSKWDPSDPETPLARKGKSTSEKTRKSTQSTADLPIPPVGGPEPTTPRESPNVVRRSPASPRDSSAPSADLPDPSVASTERRSSLKSVNSASDLATPSTSQSGAIKEIAVCYKGPAPKPRARRTDDKRDLKDSGFYVGRDYGTGRTPDRHPSKPRQQHVKPGQKVGDVELTTIRRIIHIPNCNTRGLTLHVEFVDVPNRTFKIEHFHFQQFENGPEAFKEYIRKLRQSPAPDDISTLKRLMTGKARKFYDYYRPDYD